MSNAPQVAEASMKGPRRVGVITSGAGRNAQRRVTATSVLDALVEQGFDTVLIDVEATTDLFAELRCAALDAAFLVADEWPMGHGCIQGLLECLGVPYTGSSILSTALSEDRVKAKELFRLRNIPTLAYYELCVEQLPELEQLHGSFGFPVEVHVRGGGRERVMADNLAQLADTVRAAGRRGGRVVVERAVMGERYQVAILDGRVLGGTAEGSLQALPPTRLRGLFNIAEQAAEALGCRGAVSVELLVTPAQNEFVTAVDTSPELGHGSVFERLANEAGYGFTSLCARLLRGARLDLVPRVPDNLATLPRPLVEEPVRIAV